MLKVAKVLLKNHEGRYLILYRNNHPLFGNSADLPGGTIEKGETLEDGAVREVHEESGIFIAKSDLKHLVTSTKYSRLRNEYTLYETVLTHTPEVTLSWEHLSYAWLLAEEIIEEAKTTSDRFLRMAADLLNKNGLTKG